MPRAVTLADLFKAADQASKSGLQTSMPGRVESYDENTQTASVTPVIRNPIFDTETDDPGSEEYPTIPNVMVIFPRGGGFHCSFPLVKGDHVVLVFSSLATSQWRVTGDTSEAIDVRRQSLSYPFALPGAFPDALTLRDRVTYSGKMVIGKDGDPTASIRLSPGSVECGGEAPVPLALGDTTKAALEAIITTMKAAFSALNPASGNAAAATAITTAETTTLNAAFTALVATITKGQ